MTKRMKILVVGGGTAGYVTALILNRAFDAQIDMLHSSALGIIGVGEGSTDHFYHFMKFIGVDKKTLIREADSTLKSGIMFQGWSGQDYLHHVGGPYPRRDFGYPGIYTSLIAEGHDRLSADFFWENKLPGWSISDTEGPPINQFHFNTFKLNDFLDRLARERGITITDGVVEGVTTDAAGIRQIHSTAGVFEGYDLFIDATGSRRVLMSSLDTKWLTFSDYLHMNAAFVFQTEDQENYNMWTRARAMDAGWMFTIPVWGRHGNGYIYNSNFISLEQAHQEVQEHLGRPVSIGKEFKFDPGMLEESWVQNCIAVGMAGSFVEPMEASSIGTTIQQAFLLTTLLPNMGPESRRSFNASFRSIMENIRDFVAVHYLVEREDTSWWRYNRYEARIPESLQGRLDIWKTRLPRAEDFSGDSRHILFSEDNFTVVLHGIGHFDRDAIMHSLRSRSRREREMFSRELAHQRALEGTSDMITHKEYLRQVREATVL